MAAQGSAKVAALVGGAFAFAVPASGLLDGWLGLGTGQGPALGIVLLALVYWVSEAVPLFVTGALVALLGAAVLAPWLGLPSATFVTPFASDVSLLFLGGFVLSEVLRAHGLDRVLAGLVLERTGSAAPRVLAGVLIASAGLSMWMSNTAATAMMLALMHPLLANVPAGDPLRRGLVFAVAAGANLGGMGTPIGSPPNAVAIATLERVGAAPGFAMWMLLSAPVLTLALHLTWRLLVAWHPAGIAEVELPHHAHEWTPGARGAAGLAGATVLLWLTGGLHPLSPGTVGLLPLILAFGSGLLPQEALRRLPWDVLGVVGGGLCLGVVVERSGLDRWILDGLPVGGLPTPLLLVAFAALATGLSTVMSNTAAANLILPVAVAIPGAPGLPLALVVAFACSSAMALPVSTPPNTLAFGTGEIDARTFQRTGVALTAIALGSTVLVGIPWWWLVGWLTSG